MYRRMVAPFDEALRTYDRLTLMWFYEHYLGTLYVFGVPVISMSLGSRHTEPTWKHANQYLTIVGSSKKLHQCSICNSLDLLFGVMEFIDDNVIVVTREHARTATMAYEVVSTQSMSETAIKMYRIASIEYVMHHQVMLMLRLILLLTSTCSCFDSGISGISCLASGIDIRVARRKGSRWRWPTGFRTSI